jgi:hypothetical protein
MAPSTVGSFVVLCIFVVFCGVSCYPDVPKAAPQYTINLDLPEEDRWTHVVKDYQQIVPDVYNVFK